MHTSLAAGPLRSAMLGRGIRFPCCIAASAPLTTTTISPPTKHIEFPRSVANLSTKCSTFSKKPLTHSSVREKHPLIEKTSATSQSAQSIITSSLRRNFSNSANLQASPSTSPSEVPLDWNTFFKLRASRRRYSLISSVLASITSTAAGVQILSAQDLDALGAQVMGLDPFIVLGLATAGFGAMGWLIGPILGNTVWGLVHRQYRGGVAIVSFSNLLPPNTHTDNLILTMLLKYRKRKNSSTESSASVLTRLPTRLRIRFRTTTARRLAVCKGTDNG